LPAAPVEARPPGPASLEFRKLVLQELVLRELRLRELGSQELVQRDLRLPESLPREPG